jgi:hypothetical protein
MKISSMMAIALLASSAAVAQPMGGQGGGMMQMMGGGHHCMMMMQRTEGALAFLKTELKITASQEGAWNSFAAAYRAGASSEDADHDKHGGDHKGHKGQHSKMQSFLDKAAHHQDMMETHHQGFAKRFEAAKALYGALDAGQRKTADELLMHYVMPHHGGMMGGEH